MDKKESKAVSYRLPERIIKLIVILAEKLSLSNTSIMKLAIVRLAENENVEIEEDEN